MLFSLTGPCQEGTYCPGATPYPIGCPAGSYNDLVAQSICEVCPAGYYCLENSTTYLDTPCWTGNIAAAKYCLTFISTEQRYSIVHCPLSKRNCQRKCPLSKIGQSFFYYLFTDILLLAYGDTLGESLAR